ncbi:MAG: hypothetical protein PVJ27_07255, partial [Candidatus Brocadiaceae bacterium]
DGWVYCLRASDGALVWRFRAAPEERLVGAWDQLESAWPVPGSILVVNDTAYFAAGRCSFADGGIYVYGVDPRTGDKRCETLLYGPYDEDGHEVIALGKDIEGALNDILVSDGELVYMRNTPLDLQCVQQERSAAGPHVIATGGLLDDAWNHRTFWTVNTDIGYGGSGRGMPDGEILAVANNTVYGIRGYPVGRHSTFDPYAAGYTLFSGDIEAKQATGETTEPKERKKRPRQPSSVTCTERWSVGIPLCAKAMVLVGETLFIAGTPNVYDPDDPSGAVEGRKGAQLWAMSAADGTKLAGRTLRSAPAFDGMIAANGRLYVATKSGKLVCFGPKG